MCSLRRLIELLLRSSFSRLLALHSFILAIFKSEHLGWFFIFIFLIRLIISSKIMFLVNLMFLWYILTMRRLILQMGRKARPIKLFTHVVCPWESRSCLLHHSTYSLWSLASMSWMSQTFSFFYFLINISSQRFGNIVKVLLMIEGCHTESLMRRSYLLPCWVAFIFILRCL